MKMKERLKKGLKVLGAAVAPGAAAGMMIAKAKKKKKLREGMMKATGQSKDQAAKIKRRTDIAAQRISAKRKKQNAAMAESARAGYDAAKEQMKK